MLAIILGIAFCAGSGTYAAFRGHPEHSIAYVCAGLICAAYAFYAVHVGIINGRQAFTTQAKLDMAFTTMKVLFIIGITSAGLGVNGAFIGFAIAAIAIAVWSRAQLPAVRGDSPVFGVCHICLLDDALHPRIQPLFQDRRADDSSSIGYAT